ncbi:MAG: RNA polymerase sigma factor [Methyloligellaceae bacterium]
MLLAVYARYYAYQSPNQTTAKLLSTDTEEALGPGRMGNVKRSDEETDEMLVTRIVSRDVTAFSLLSERYLVKIVAASRNMLGDDAEAEDVAQECFLRLWNKAESFNPDKARFSTWLYRIAGNLCIDRLRKKKAQGVQEPIEYAESLAVPADQERQFAAKQLEERVDQALQRLPERQRQALVLCHFQGLRMKEACSVMEISVEALESLLARARRSLKKELQEEWMQFMPERSGPQQ